MAYDGTQSRTWYRHSKSPLQVVSGASQGHCTDWSALYRHATTIFSRLCFIPSQYGVDVAQEQHDLKPIVTPPHAFPSGALSTIMGGFTPSPGPSPTLDGAFAGVPVEVVDFEDLRFGRILGSTPTHRLHFVV